MCCFSNLKRNMKSCRCFSDHGNVGWHTATMKGSCTARFQKSRSTAFGKRKVLILVLMFCPRMLRVQRHPPHPPGFQVFVDPLPLLALGRKWKRLMLEPCVNLTCAFAFMRKLQVVSILLLRLVLCPVPCVRFLQALLDGLMGAQMFLVDLASLRSQRLRLQMRIRHRWIARGK